MRKAAVVLALLLVASVAAAKTRDDAYILCVGPFEPRAFFTTGASVSQIKAVHARHYGGDFLWVRRNGRETVIRDAAFLARAQALFAPLRALAPEQRAVAREEAALDREDDRLDELSDRGVDVRQQRRDLQEKQRNVAARERDVDRREEELERAEEAELWRMVDEAMARE